MPAISIRNVHTDQWEIGLEDLPAPVTRLTLSPDGLRVEAGRLRWDLIPWQELADLIDDGPRDRNLRAVVAGQRRELLRRILAQPGVVPLPGPMPPPSRAHRPDAGEAAR